MGDFDAAQIIAAHRSAPSIYTCGHEASTCIDPISQPVVHSPQASTAQDVCVCVCLCVCLYNTYFQQRFKGEQLVKMRETASQLQLADRNVGTPCHVVSNSGP